MPEALVMVDYQNDFTPGGAVGDLAARRDGDHRVRATALEALREAFGIALDTAGSRGSDAEPGDADRARDEVCAAGGEVR
jgi:hypothetical protein